MSAKYSVGEGILSAATGITYTIDYILEHHTPNQDTTYSYMITPISGGAGMEVSETLIDIGFHILANATLDPAGKVPASQLPSSKYVVELPDAATLHKQGYRNRGIDFVMHPDVLADALGCQHNMKEYHGLRETFRYCTKCDHKE